MLFGRARCIRRLPNVRHAVPLRRWQTTSSTFDNISPALLARAQSIANEHATLTERLATDFDSNAARRLGELTSTTLALKEYENARISLKELYSLLQSSDEELRELAEDDVESTRERIEQASSALKSSLIPVHPLAHLPCLIEIRPGAGGDEAGIFTGDLYRMYEAYCSRSGLQTSLLKLDSQDYTGSSGAASAALHAQEVILEVQSPGAYGILRCEAGVHRVQRVPATERQGRVHTSVASVIVLPSLPSETSHDEASFDDPNNDYYVDPKDVRTDILKASGAGGQHVNKTESAVRLTHAPSGIVVSMQDSRSQMQNREKAWRVLRARIAQRRREEREAEQAQMRRNAGVGKTGRGDKVRTYNFNQQRVSDHRSGLDLRNLDEIMEGGDALEKVMQSVRSWMAEQEMLEILAEEESKLERK